MIPPVSGKPIPAQPVSSSPSRGPGFRRNHFHALFEQTALEDATAPPVRSLPRPAASPARSPEPTSLPKALSEPALAIPNRSDDARLASPTTPSTAPASSSVLGLDWYTPIASPISLDPLLRAMEQAGLSTGQFEFQQLEAFQPFPGRSDLSYTTRQVLIRGPRGMGLFDLGLATRTPWVTATELRSYGIV